MEEKLIKNNNIDNDIEEIRKNVVAEMEKERLLYITTEPEKTEEDIDQCPNCGSPLEEQVTFIQCSNPNCNWFLYLLE